MSIWKLNNDILKSVKAFDASTHGKATLAFCAFALPLRLCTVDSIIFINENV